MLETAPRFARDANVTIGVVIYEGVEPIDIGGTAGVLSMARRVLPNLSYRTIAEKAGPVTLAGGLVVVAADDFERTAAMRSHHRLRRAWLEQSNDKRRHAGLPEAAARRTRRVCMHRRVDPGGCRPARRPYRHDTAARRTGRSRRRHSSAYKALRRHRQPLPPPLSSIAGF